MILTLKTQRVRMLDGWTLEIMTNCEDFRDMLDQHSPNMLIDYLRERYGLHIDYVEYTKKGGCHGTL